MSKTDKLYAIVETYPDGTEVFFNGLLRAGHYNKSYKLSVFKYEKTAQNRLDEIQSDYQRRIDDTHWYRPNETRIIGELSIQEYSR